VDWFVRAFLKSSLVWFAVGATLGLAMAIHPPFAVYRTAHLHINLLGFVGQMIYGVSLHVVPRFFGHPLVHPRLAAIQFWLAQPGLALIAGGFALRVHGATLVEPAIVAGAVLSTAAAGCYIVNLWATINASSMKPLAPARKLPLAHQPQAD